MKKKELEKIKKNQKAITLITLAITVIVLLILAGVTIAAISGNNGILQNAARGKERTEQANTDELRKLTQLEAATHLEDYEYIDNSTGEEKTITIPAECAVSQVEGENTLENGLVIIDASGNEWVWVEVPKTEEVYRNAGTNLDVNNITDEQCDTIYNDLSDYVSAYRNHYTDTFGSTEQNGYADATAYNVAKNNMLRSVYKNEGFWVGRYEAGDAVATASNTTRTSAMGNTNEAVIKANQIPYNYITCKQAQELATRLSIGEKTSSLMFGIQWNLVCKFLEEKTTLNENDINGDSTNWGNYLNSSVVISRGKYNTTPNSPTSQWLDIAQIEKNGKMLLTTGVSEDTNKMNIYDLAGNVREWTLAYTTNTALPCVVRGGNYTSNGYGLPASGSQR